MLRLKSEHQERKEQDRPRGEGCFICKQGRQSCDLYGNKYSRIRSWWPHKDGNLEVSLYDIDRAAALDSHRSQVWNTWWVSRWGLLLSWWRRDSLYPDGDILGGWTSHLVSDVSVGRLGDRQKTQILGEDEVFVWRDHSAAFSSCLHSRHRLWPHWCLWRLCWGLGLYQSYWLRLSWTALIQWGSLKQSCR